MRRLALALLTLTVLAAACGGSGLVISPPTTSATSTTLAPSTSSINEATTTTAATTTTTMESTTTAPLTYRVDPTDLYPDVFSGVFNGAHGSGCVIPGFDEGWDELPDGVWFGFVETIGGDSMTFDLACFFSDEAACLAQWEDGNASGPEDCLDLWIRNSVDIPSAVPISPTARVWYVDAMAPEWDNTFEIPLASWPTAASYQICASDYCAVWLYVNGGLATGIVEQYLP